MTRQEYVAADATELARKIREGECSAGEVLDAALDRLHEVNPSLNAVISTRIEAARKEASGIGAALAQPFAGVPFLIKDLTSTLAGHPSTAGSRLLRGWTPAEDSELVARWRAAGLVILGSTNSPEFGLLPITEPVAYGPTRNPWNLDHTPGGSSGGSGAAVAAGIVPMAGAGDGGGSIRIPASCCGLFGLKPTRQRTPVGPGGSAPWRGAVVEHVLTRSVRDSAALLDAVAAPEAGALTRPPLPGGSFLSAAGREPEPLRIGWTTTPMLHREVDPECVEGVHATVSILEELGHHCEEVEIPFEGETFARNFLLMLTAELAAEVAEIERTTGRKAGPGSVETESWALTLAGRSLPASRAALALRDLEREASGVMTWLDPWDLLLTPTLSRPPVRIGEIRSTPFESFALKLLGRIGSGRLIRMAGLIEEAAADAFLFTPWTPVFNITGQPAMSVPLHESRSGLPIGMHFVGRFGDEETLFSLAGQLERRDPWKTLQPGQPPGITPSRGVPQGES